MKIGRREFDITDKDIIFDNGASLQLATQTYQDGWCRTCPTMSKSQFNKLIKNKCLSLVKEKFSYTMTNGKDVYFRYYKFDINKLKELNMM